MPASDEKSPTQRPRRRVRRRAIASLDEDARTGTVVHRPLDSANYHDRIESSNAGRRTGRLRSCRHRAEMAGALGEARDEPHRPRCRRAPVLRADDVPVPVGGGAARRQPLRVHRATTSMDDSSGCRGTRSSSRWASTRSASTPRTSRSRSGRIPTRADPAEHRQLPPPAEARRPDGRLAARAVDHRSRATTSGRSGSFCSSTSAGWPTRSARRSTGARTTRPCSPTSRSSPASASGAARTVEQRFLEQWFFRITDYAGRLLDNLDWLDWSETTKTAQRNWIGRSEGAEIAFRVQDLEDSPASRRSTSGVSGEFTAEPIDISVFTTRPDTIFGATYLVLAPEHPLVDALTTPTSSARRSRRTASARRSRTSSRAR